jgi:alpha-ketoglutarate-dependent 2,4-dichlorophenoxyacetate dioxygenase
MFAHSYYGPALYAFKGKSLEDADMAITVKSLHPLFVAEVSGVDPSRPVDPETFLEVEAALDRHAVLIVRETPLNDEQQIAFSRLFGRLETPVGSIRKDRKRRVNEGLADVSNLDASNNICAAEDRWRLMMLANQLWHTDSSFKRVSGKVSLLSAHEVPPTGGETEFADLRAAYEALDGAMKRRLDGAMAEHSIFYSRTRVGYDDFSEEERVALPPVPRPVVRVHPGSGRITLYLASHASHIVGWPTAEGRAVLETLIDFATQPRFVYSHRWQRDDFVIWDNRCTVHRARPYDDAHHRRDMRRTTVEDSEEAVVAPGIGVTVGLREVT